MKQHRTSWIIVTVMAALQSGCGHRLETATLVEGRGVEPDLIVGSTTLAQARSALGKSAREPSTTGNETEVVAGPLQLKFVTPDGGGDPVLQAIRTSRIPNPSYPRWTGKTSKGIGFLDAEQTVREAYGPPAAEWDRMTGGRVFYYTTGLILVLEQPAKITGYDGPPAAPPPAGNVVEVYVTPPFQIVEGTGYVMSGQQVVYTAPRTTLRIAP